MERFAVLAERAYGLKSVTEDPRAETFASAPTRFVISSDDKTGSVWPSAVHDVYHRLLSASPRNALRFFHDVARNVRWLDGGLYFYARRWAHDSFLRVATSLEPAIEAVFREVLALPSRRSRLFHVRGLLYWIAASNCGGLAPSAMGEIPAAQCLKITGQRCPRHITIPAPRSARFLCAK